MREPDLFGPCRPVTGACADERATGSTGADGTPVVVSGGKAPGLVSAESAACPAHSACTSTAPLGAVDGNRDDGVDYEEDFWDSGDDESDCNSSKSSTPGGSSDTDAVVSPGVKTAEQIAAVSTHKNIRNTTSAAVRK